MHASAAPLTAVVTGGAGFIGSHLVERLLVDGHRVRAVDNLATGTWDNLATVAGHARLEMHRLDVADLEAVTPIMAGADWVFHLAALADIVPSIQRPLDYHRANVDGTANLLEAARSAGVRRFVYAASSSRYGIPDVYPTPESAPARPMYPYALTKELGEQYVLHWHRTYGLPAVALRLFNVYGPRARTSGTYGAVFGVFLAQKLAGQPFTVVGDGTQMRDFTFVSDVVDGFVRMAESDVVGEALNVGSGQPVSVNRLVDLLDGPVTHLPRRPGEPDRTHADIARIRERLGWSPQVSFEDGVRIMLDHIDYWRAAPVWSAETIRDATADWFRYLGQESPA